MAAPRAAQGCPRGFLLLPSLACPTANRYAVLHNKPLRLLWPPILARCCVCERVCACVCARGSACVHSRARSGTTNQSICSCVTVCMCWWTGGGLHCKHSVKGSVLWATSPVLRQMKRSRRHTCSADRCCCAGAVRGRCRVAWRRLAKAQRRNGSASKGVAIMRWCPIRPRRT